MAILTWISASFAVSLAVLTISIITSRRFSRTAVSFTTQLEKLGNDHSKEIQTIIAKELSPSIHLHDGPQSVTLRANHIIREVADDPNQANRHIAFYGAASLAAMTGDDESKINGSGGKKDKPKSSDIYWDAIRHASKKHVRMRRYVSLFTPIEIRERSDPVQIQYLKWLNRQYQLLDDDDRYQLIHVVRAPQWGTNMARIITKSAVMEITGNGRAAIVITDAHIAERIREYAREAVSGKNPLNPAVPYGQTIGDRGNLNEFRHYIQTIETACSEERQS